MEIMKAFFALVVAGVAISFLTTPVDAGGQPGLRVGHRNVEVGEQSTIFVEAVDVPSSGLGAWAIDIRFDPGIIDAIDCTSEQGGVCSPAFADDTVRVTGAVTQDGLTGTFPLASFTFVCAASGVSHLEVSEALFTTADPEVEIGDLYIEDGSITCREPGVGGLIGVGSHEANVGDQVPVVVEAKDIPEPGLGVWTVDVTYDNEVVSLVSCEPREDGICNPEWDENTFRVTGVSARGLVGTTELARVVLSCDALGTSALSVQLQLGSIFLPDDPRNFTETAPGRLTCSERRAATPAPPPTQLPDTGAGIPPRPSSLPTVGLLALGGTLLASAALALRRPTA